MFDHLIVEKREAVEIITLNRPHVLNALNREMRWELTEALRIANQAPDIGAIVLTGAGERAFAAGQDLNEAKDFTSERAHSWIDEFFALYSAIRNVDKATVSALNGYAVGAGLQIALLTDLRVASEGAQLGMPEIYDGIPCITGTWTLWDIIGRSRTEDLVLTGRLLGAQEALDWGLVNRVVPQAEVIPTALSLAADLATKPRTAVRLNKDRWRALTQRAAEDARDAAKLGHSTAFASGEPRAAMDAFLAKRGARGR
jgi:enoyl-CoA hydratase/carnithine racemase